MIDMEAASEELRDIEDEIETLRDPSHVKNLSKDEMKAFFEENNLFIKKCETTKIQQSLKSWLALTKTPEAVREKIAERMKADVEGHEKTGFCPYLKEGDICFDQKWVLILGEKLK